MKWTALLQENDVKLVRCEPGSSYNSLSLDLTDEEAELFPEGEVVETSPYVVRLCAGAGPIYAKVLAGREVVTVATLAKRYGIEQTPAEPAVFRSEKHAAELAELRTENERLRAGARVVLPEPPPPFHLADGHHFICWCRDRLVVDARLIESRGTIQEAFSSAGVNADEGSIQALISGHRVGHLDCGQGQSTEFVIFFAADRGVAGRLVRELYGYGNGKFAELKALADRREEELVALCKTFGCERSELQESAEGADKLAEAMLDTLAAAGVNVKTPIPEHIDETVMAAKALPRRVRDLMDVVYATCDALNIDGAGGEELSDAAKAIGYAIGEIRGRADGAEGQLKRLSECEPGKLEDELREALACRLALAELLVSLKIAKDGEGWTPPKAQEAIDAKFQEVVSGAVKLITENERLEAERARHSKAYRRLQEVMRGFEAENNRLKRAVETLSKTNVDLALDMRGDGVS